MKHRRSLAFIALCAGLSSFFGCAGPEVFLAKHRQEGPRAQFNLPIDQLNDALATATLEGNQPLILTPRQGEENSFNFNSLWTAGGAQKCPCVLDLYPQKSRSQAKVLCTFWDLRWYEQGECEKTALDAISAAIGRIVQSRLTNPTASGLGREELTSAVEAAVKGTLAAQGQQGGAAKAVSSDVDQPSYKKNEDVDQFAVVIGIEKYQNLPQATFAAHDAEAMRAHLLALGVPQRNIFYATDLEATRAGLVKAVHTWLPNRVNEKSTVYFYFSGHGAPDPESHEAYLVPIDGDPEALADTAYPLKSLYHNLSQLKAKRVIVALDSCFSGAGGRSVVAGGTRPLVTVVNKPALSGEMLALSAAGGDQVSGTIDDQGHGAFTYYLLKGLNGDAAQANAPVTVQALYNYLRPKVADAARQHNRDQTPELMLAPEASANWTIR